MHNTSFVYADIHQWSKSGRLLFLGVFLSFVSLINNKLAAQNCQFSFADCPFPASLGICDVTFSAPLTIEHGYASDHTFTVVVTFEPNRFNLANPSVLEDFFVFTDASGNTVVTGSVTVPFDPVNQGVSSSRTIQLLFDRLGIWNGVDKLLSVQVFDEDCGIDPVAFFDPVINIFPQFVDLRNLSPLASALQANGTLTTCGSGFVDNILIGDELIVDPGVDLCFLGGGGGGPNSSIAFLPGAKIVVQGGGTLTLDHVNVFTCGEELATGIEVLTNGTAKISNSDLRDARFAVNAQPGSTLDIRKNTFSDNYIGLKLDMSAAPEAGKRVNLTGFAGNTFTTASASIKAPFLGMPEAIENRGYCGILLNDYRDFNVFSAEGNHFSALANGILVRRSTLNLGNMTFTDMNSTGPSVYPLEGFGIRMDGKGPRPYWAHINELWHNMTFTNCKTGLYASHYAGQVDKLTMNSVIRGIDWSQSQQKDIRMRQNDISARDYGIRSFRNEPLALNSAISDNDITITGVQGGLTPVTGIELQEFGLGSNLGGGWPVLRNDITLNAGGRGILYRNGVAGAIDGNSVTNLSMPNNYTGIFTEANLFANVSRNTVTQSSAIGLGAATGIFSAAGTANTYQCNCLDNTHVGAQFYDLADFTNAVRGNNFNTHTTGLQLGSAGVGDVFIGRQNRTGNWWDLSQIPAGAFGGVHWGGQFEISRSIFLVPGVMGSNAEHPEVDPGDDWFIQTPGSSFTCSSACAFPPEPGTPTGAPETSLPTDLDYAIAGGTLGSHPDMVWKGQYRLYRKMLRRPELENYAPIFAGFKAAQANLPSGKLATIAEERAKLFQLNPADQSTDATFRSSIAQQTADLRSMDSLLQAGVSVNMTQYNALVQQKATNESNYTAFLQTRATARQQQIQNLLTLNAGVSTSSVMIANHQTLNNIVLHLLANDESQPSEANLSVLAAIAGQCPISGGDAVYEARAIVERITGATFEDAVLCNTGNRPSNERTISTTFSAGQIQVFPNPTTGMISWTGLEGEAVTLQVFNALGQQVAERNSTENGVDLSHLPSGVYHIKFLTSDNTIRLNKSVVLEK